MEIKTPPSPDDSKEEHPDNNDNKGRGKLHLTFLIILWALLILFGIGLMDAGNYGWTLFCIIPFSIGLSIGVYSERFQDTKQIKGCLLVIVVLAAVSGLLFLIGIEGVICILMALGLLALPAWLGVFIGYTIRKMHRLYSIAVIFLLNTSSYIYDESSNVGFQSITSEKIEISASQQKVWQVLTHPVAFTNSENFFLRAGVSYPKEMRLEKSGQKDYNLVCDYRNGITKLKIIALDSLKQMRFTMPEEILPMKELTFHQSLDAPHLHGYFQPVFGEFSLSAVDANHCVLTATTAYRYKITPEFYWRWWADYLANAMHRQVLHDVKNQSEKNN